MAHRSRSTRRLLVALALAGVLTACSGGADSGGASGTTSNEAAAPATAAGALDRGDARRLDAVVGQEVRRAARTGPLAREVIATGEATLQAEDVAGLRDDVGRLVERFGGYVSSERSSNDEKGRLVEDRLVVRVPSSRFDQLMAEFDVVATVLDATTKSDDVTTEVIDVDSRVRTAEVSLDRLRGFLRRSNDVNALIRLESEMAEREADLASLRAQQDYLEDQTSLATVTVTLQRSPEEEPEDRSGDGGFLAGLSGGWDALQGALVVAATVIGAVIPFVLVGAVLGVPALLMLRAARRRRPAAAPPAPSGTT